MFNSLQLVMLSPGFIQFYLVDVGEGGSGKYCNLIRVVQMSSKAQKLDDQSRKAAHHSLSSAATTIYHLFNKCICPN